MWYCRWCDEEHEERYDYCPVSESGTDDEEEDPA